MPFFPIISTSWSLAHVVLHFCINRLSSTCFFLLCIGLAAGVPMIADAMCCPPDQVWDLWCHHFLLLIRSSIISALENMQTDVLVCTMWMVESQGEFPLALPDSTMATFVNYWFGVNNFNSSNSSKLDHFQRQGL
jgi:hypothetical protein